MAADAPRFRAYWERLEDRSVLTMSRSDWSALSATTGTPVQISVAQTPMAGLASRASVVRALAQQSSSATGEVAIIRHDVKDAPTPYNVDKYTVWTDVLAHPSLQGMISGASTELNDNFRQFAADTVFLIKQDPGPDHWLPSLPGSATTIVQTK
jgi:hypothetical protein